MAIGNVRTSSGRSAMTVCVVIAFTLLSTCVTGTKSIGYEQLLDHCNDPRAVPLMRSSLLGYSRHTNILHNCSMALEAGDTRWPHLQLLFRHLNLTESPHCSLAKILFVDGGRAITPPEGVCGDSPPSLLYRTVVTSVVHVILEIAPPPRRTSLGDFEILLTTFHYPLLNATCQDYDFHCRNNICISKALLCNGYNNCGDNSDEHVGCGFRLGVSAIVGIVIGAAVVVIIVCTIIILGCFRRARSRPPQWYTEVNRQSEPINEANRNYAPFPYYGTGTNVPPGNRRQN